MANYKVIQDIEAEDKLLGPLTLRQFIYASVVAVMGFVAFRLAIASPFLAIPFVPPIVFFGLLAAPFGHDQSSEVWLLAKIRFFLKPRRRIWDQTGLQELVTITVPKLVEKHLTDGLSQTEVKSRLKALATTIDSRGWAIKNTNNSDRLVQGTSIVQDVPDYQITAADDILDEISNPTAQHLQSMILQSDQTHHQAVVAAMQQSQPITAPAAVPDNGYGMVNPADEQNLLTKLHTESSLPNPAYGHTKVLDPNPKPKPIPSPDTVARLTHNNDLTVATIEREANRPPQPTGLPDQEVTVSLR